MSKKLTKEEKQAELLRFQELVLIVIDYNLKIMAYNSQPVEFSINAHFKALREQVKEHFQQGRLTVLKQWFRDLTEGIIESGDFRFTKYLQDRTIYHIDIFKSFHQKIDRIIEKGRITSANQYYDVNIMVDQLSQTQPVDKEKLDVLNGLLFKYKPKNK